MTTTNQNQKMPPRHKATKVKLYSLLENLVLRARSESTGFASG